MTFFHAAGYAISVKAGTIDLQDVHPDRDDHRISVHEARELAQRLLHAAAAAERQAWEMATR